MEAKCKYCGGEVTLADEWVCISCGTVLSPLWVAAQLRKRLTTKEMATALLRRYA